MSTNRPLLLHPHEVRAILAGRQSQFRRAMNPSPPDYLAGREPWNISGEIWGFRARSGSVSACRSEDTLRCPYGRAGDILYVQEPWTEMREKTPADRQGAQEAWERYMSGQQTLVDAALSIPSASGERRALYCWDFPDDARLEDVTWQYARTMPRWASRITLEIVSVRVERLQEISYEDAEAEGTLARQCGCSLDGERECGLGPDCEAARTDIDWFHALWDSINGKTHPWSSDPYVWCISFRRL